MKYTSLFLVLGLWLCWGCGDAPSPSTPEMPSESPDLEESTPETQSPSASLSQQAIIHLEDYYAALEAEQIDVSNHFAPTVTQFFGSRDIPREQIAESLKQGFESLDDRKLVIDPNSVELTETAQGYEVVFQGTSRATRVSDGSVTEGPFANRVAFNRDWKITAYTAAEQKSRQLPMATRGLPSNDVLAVAQRTLEGFKSGDLASLADLTNPDLGVYFIVHPGAMSYVYQHQSIEGITEQAPWLGEGTSALSITPVVETLPEFDCTSLFSKEGCFLDQESGPYDQVSSLMNSLNRIENGLYESPEVAAARRAERYVQAVMVDTPSGMAFGFGQVEGSWYLLVIDIASYDCSA